jgi:hypothetical protein
MPRLLLLTVVCCVLLAPAARAADAKPDVIFTPPAVPPDKRHGPVELTATIRLPAGTKGDVTLELLLGDGSDDRRSFPAERVGEGQYRLKVVPVADGDERIPVTVLYPAGSVECKVADKVLVLDGKGYNLSELRKVERTKDGAVLVPRKGPELKGAKLELGQARIVLGGEAQVLELDRAVAVVVNVERADQVKYTLVTKLDGKVIGEFPGIWTLAPAPEATGPVPDPKLDKLTEVPLGEAFDKFCVGGAGRYYVFHLKEAKKLAVFDVSQMKVVQKLDVGADDVLFTAGLDKLVVVLPSEKLVQRWDLHTLKREKAVPLDDDHAVLKVLMGSASKGPVLLWTGGKVAFRDLESMQPLEVKGDVMNGDKTYDFRLRVSADGQTFMGWHNGIGPTTFGLMRLDGPQVTLLQTPDAFSFNGRWAVPSADGSLVFRYGSGVYSADLKVVSGELFKESVLMPTEDPRFFLALRGLNKPASEVSICTAADRRSVYTIKDLEKTDPGTTAVEWGLFQGEPRFRYVPSANVFLTIPDSNDKVIVRPFNLTEALDKTGEAYLFVISRPPTRARAATTYKYQIEAQSKEGGLKYNVESGPDGLTVSEKGEVRWEIPPGQRGKTVKVVLSIKDAGGKEVFHTFDVAVE